MPLLTVIDNKTGSAKMHTEIFGKIANALTRIRCKRAELLRGYFLPTLSGQDNQLSVIGMSAEQQNSLQEELDYISALFDLSPPIRIVPYDSKNIFRGIKQVNEYRSDDRYKIAALVQKVPEDSPCCTVIVEYPGAEAQNDLFQRSFCKSACKELVRIRHAMPILKDNSFLADDVRLFFREALTPSITVFCRETANLQDINTAMRNTLDTMNNPHVVGYIERALQDCQVKVLPALCCELGDKITKMMPR